MAKSGLSNKILKSFSSWDYILVAQVGATERGCENALVGADWDAQVRVV